MKKKYWLFSIIIVLLLIPNIYAKTTTNGVNITNPNQNGTRLYCEYGRNTLKDIHIIIKDFGHAEIEELSPDSPDTLVAINSLFPNSDYSEFQKYNFLDSNNNWDCPLYAVFNDENSTPIDFSNEELTVEIINQKYSFSKISVYSLYKNGSVCEGICRKYDSKLENENSKYKCEYKGPSGNITISGDSSNKCLIVYPDGSNKEMVNGICGVTSSSSCPDFFYNKRTKEFKTASYDYAKWFKESKKNYNSEMRDFICGNDSDNVEYYCSGACQYKNNKNIDCNEIDQKISGVSNDTKLMNICEQEGILKGIRFIGYLLYIVKILIPIILIVMGSMDFGKAIMASNQDAVIKSAKMFATRIIMGVCIFLLPTVVNFVFSLIPSSVEEFRDCRSCLFNPTKCNITEDEEN